MEPNIPILPSVMCCKPWDLEAYVRAFEKVGIAGIHFDVMDGHYVPNIMLGVSDFDAIRALTDLPLDVHLMCMEPERYLPYFKFRKGDWVSFHPEVCRQPYRLLQSIQSEQLRAGLALSPGIPVSYVQECLSVLDFVLVMAVNPGFAGQKMVPDHLEKLSSLSEITKKAGHPIDIIIDGNTTPENAKAMYRAGATGFVTGTSSMLSKGPEGFESMYTDYLSALTSR